jgi:hypothetical protein
MGRPIFVDLAGSTARVDPQARPTSYINTDQAEAYKDACVREALELAAETCTNSMMRNTDSYCVATAHYCADRIRAQIKYLAQQKAEPNASKGSATPACSMRPPNQTSGAIK